MTARPERPQPVAELARRLSVHKSTVARAIDAAHADPNIPDPPEPTVDDLGRAYYPPAAFMAWWPHRRPPGRPRRSPNAPETDS